MYLSKKNIMFITLSLFSTLMNTFLPQSRSKRHNTRRFLDYDVARTYHQSYYGDKLCGGRPGKCELLNYEVLSELKLGTFYTVIKIM